MNCSECNGICCWAGVELQEDEAPLIKTFVDENKEYFSFLPDEYIVNNRIQTKPRIHKHSIQGIDDTVCVFNLDNGYCALQARCIELGKHQWSVKPEACWLAPLRIEDGVLIYPGDEGNEEYDDYFSILPCGEQIDILDWEEKLSEEIAWAKNKMEVQAKCH